MIIFTLFGLFGDDISHISNKGKLDLIFDIFNIFLIAIFSLEIIL